MSHARSTRGIAAQTLGMGVLVATVACGGGGGGAPPTTPATSAGDARSPATRDARSTAPAPAPAATPTAAPATPSSSSDAPLDDPTESPGVIPMHAEITRPTAKGAFPKATVGDRECWQNTSITGDHAKDYAILVDKCGAATGLAEYAKPVQGKVNHLHDKRDTYSLKLLGGYCYRYFAVADDTIEDLDVLVQKPNGALVADDKTVHPIAIIEGDKPWCMDEDGEYHFHVEVDGPGKGGYTFGVWARPKR